MSEQALDLSIVVVNWNAGDSLAACVRSIAAYPPKGSWEVVLVDNASVDGSVDTALAAMPALRVVRNHRNLGLPAANNQGLASSRGRRVLISNPDVEYRAGAIAAMQSTMDRHERAAFVIPRLTHEDGRLHTSAGDLPTLPEALLGRRAQRSRRSGRADAGYWWDRWGHDEERAIGRGHEAAYLVDRRAIDDVGPQDEGFVLDWEGHDWTARMRRRGWEVWFAPDAEVMHRGGVSIRQVPFRWVVRSHRGMYRYFAKQHPGWRPWLLPVVSLRAGAKLVTAALSDTYERGHRG